MESKDLKTISIVCGSISFIITMWGFPTYYNLLQFIFSSKLAAEELTPRSQGKYVTLSGRVSATQSFQVIPKQNKTDQKEPVVFSRLKTKYHVIGATGGQLYSKSVKYVNFEIDGPTPIHIVPAYHTKFRSPTIYEKFTRTVSTTENIFYSLLRIIIAPIFSVLGFTIKTGETVTEKAISSRGFVTVAGRVKWINGKISMVPDLVAPKISDIFKYLTGKAAWVLIGQSVFIGLSSFLWYLAVKREKELKISRKELSGNKELKCYKCGKPCDMFFEPCLDIAACQVCSESLTSCPKCSTPITLKIPIHLS